ncbi:MAG: metallophosphoesterase [Acidobacteria bacterium]|nr:metallophosphoesterase [Acidobacteriota bacterium]
MDESELRGLYETQLAERARNRYLPEYDRTAAGVVLNACRRLPATTLPPEDEERTWVFSDPHFEHEGSIHAFGRPFWNSAQGDAHLLKEWTLNIRKQDTVLCLGDVTMGCPSHVLIDLLRRAPGRKILVVGNHDNAFLAELESGFDEVACCAHLPGGYDEPELLCTHIPLDRVPDGYVNVHGHVHRKSTVDKARINVCVEQIEYTPVPMPDIRTLAQRLEIAARVDPPHRFGSTPTHRLITWAKNLASVGAAGEGAGP